MDTPPYLRLKKTGAEIDVVVTPGAKRNRIVGTYGQRLKIALAAPPVDGKANAALIRLFAEQLTIPKSKITISKGETSKQKTLLISGGSEEILKVLK